MLEPPPQEEWDQAFRKSHELIHARKSKSPRTYCLGSGGSGPGASSARSRIWVWLNVGSSVGHGGLWGVDVSYLRVRDEHFDKAVRNGSEILAQNPAAEREYASLMYPVQRITTEQTRS